MIFKYRIRGLLGMSAVLVALLDVVAYAHVPIPPKRTEIGRKESSSPAKEFTLVDQSGTLFHFKPASGKFILVTFVYTSCPDVCPLLTAKFAAIQRSLEEKKRGDYMLLTISTDPERDTPSKMNAYAQAYKADLRRWRFLTGSHKDLAQVWKDFGVTVRELGNGQIQHTNLTTLIDPEGVRRVDYYGDKWQEKEVLKDFKALEGSR
jgi:protein SCO1